MIFASIDDELKARVPGIRLYCIECDVTPEESPAPLLEMIEEKCRELRCSLKLEDISALPAIRASRSAYKACGKDPARYRLSAEALLRRIVKGEELYRIGNVVDLLNLVSLSTGFSIGGYDAGKIEGEIHMGIGKPGEPYRGLGRGDLNIEGLPVFRDNLGAFGSPTSDSERTGVDPSTRRFLMIIIGFGNSGKMDEAARLSIQLLGKYAGASNMETNITEG
ncbi:MAG: phenylalanine--tRNA ligase beta subunit-related protein [Prolixibacteraceae bacterium]|jgi:DNA/RNA-binding domain of Phe-tRNA-synthetase-like protein|nr:hypothetical protein [Prolixibacteraceae bacterium]MDI9564961.1 phenylalanine--tRNA ligase beta subunit-related protein [Bacteroidota bacterium]NLS99578.1 hypothetical protein [Bacteroidales bacterium]OQB82022.1 MAG: B3/4 domain protein [Bacteroidetes bacterium ADurb.Bin123]HNZ69707.1 phenylalanine--tRNA ligase beta subunit-related protein [Prolixibacteraceae bacterium]